MSWYRRANEDEARTRVQGLLNEMYGGIPEPFGQQRWPHLTHKELLSLEKELLSERERKKLKDIETARQTEDKEIVHRNVPPEIYDRFSVQPVFETDVLTRYVWGTQEEVQATISSGLKMNEGHSSLPAGWGYLHFGDEEWIAILNKDYGRDGPVCELEISGLPEGFFIIEDTDIMDKTDAPDSLILISKQPIIPSQCIKISRVLDTEEVSQNYPQYDDEEGEEGY